MLIDDIIADAKHFTEKHWAIYHNLLPDMEVTRQFLEYAYQEVDSPEILAELWVEDTSLGLVSTETGSGRDVHTILKRNVAAKIHDAMLDHRDTLL